jgi:hypothetical protein
MKSKTHESPIFSKIPYENAVEIKRNILNTQINLLNIMKKVNDYRDLRKKEFLYKLKIKNNLKEIKEQVNYIFNTFPKTKMLDERKPIKHEKKEKTISVTSGIDKELQEIRERLNNLN